MRLDALLSRLGFGSRSETQRLIRAGKVRLDGETVTDPSRSFREEKLFVNGAETDTRLKRTILMNKPKGLLTAAEDPRQETVFSILPRVYAKLSCMPVGRLDKDTTGALLFTTDGELAHRLISPKRDIEKVYVARVDTALCPEDIEAFRKGVVCSDFTAKPALLTILEPNTARITVTEGKYHQVKRMLKARGHETLSLKRIRFGPIVLDEALQEGSYRELTEEETAALYRAAGM